MPFIFVCLSNTLTALAEDGPPTPCETLYQQAVALQNTLVVAEALRHYEQLLALDCQNPSLVADALHHQGDIYFDQERFGEAESAYQKSLTLKENRAEDESLALTLNSLGLLYSYQEDYVRAEPLSQRALAIREKVYGLEHPEVAASLNNLALLYETLNDYAHAESLYQRSLAIKEKVLGAQHPSAGSRK